VKRGEGWAPRLVRRRKKQRDIAVSRRHKKKTSKIKKTDENTSVYQGRKGETTKSRQTRGSKLRRHLEEELRRVRNVKTP